MRAGSRISPYVALSTYLPDKAAPHMKSPSPNGEGESRPSCRKDQPLVQRRTAILPIQLPCRHRRSPLLQRRNIGIGRRNEGRDLAVLGAADAVAGPEPRIVVLVRLIIRHVDHFVFVDGDVARPADGSRRRSKRPPTRSGSFERWRHEWDARSSRSTETTASAQLRVGMNVRSSIAFAGALPSASSTRS